MICILSFDDKKELKGWALANDLKELKKVAPAFGSDYLPIEINQMDGEPKEGRHLLKSGLIMLVS